MADIVAVAAASGLAAATSAATAAELAWMAALLPGWLVLAKLHGLYDRDHRALRHLTSQELPMIVSWATTGTAIGVLGMSIIGVDALPISIAARLWLVLVVLDPLFRSGARAIWRAVTPPDRAVIVGSGTLAEVTQRKIDLFGDIHVLTVATIDSLPETGDGDDVRELLDSSVPAGMERIILASEAIDERLIAELVAYARARGAKLSVIPPMRGVFGTAARLSHVAELPTVEYSTWHTPRSTTVLKRVLDVAVSTAGLILLGPLLALIAVAIRLDAPGRSLFAQWRAGRNGRPFRMYKFRTMVHDAEDRRGEVVRLEQLADPMFKLRRDPRVTRIGRVLRRTSLDELPQLLNVLRGDMSLVGPRPEEVDLVSRYRDEHLFRLTVKPGLTGPMQVFGRGELRFDERLAVERDYIDNLSVERDLQILLRTASVVLRGKGAF